MSADAVLFSSVVLGCVGAALLRRKGHAVVPVENAKPAKPVVGALRDVPFMGVIYVVDEAHKLGFYNGNPEWSNLGQGQPEVGELAGAPARITHVSLEPTDHAYGPLGGLDELKQAVANHYNRLYRVGKPSQYTASNVSVCSGGRLALTRIFAALDKGVVGYQSVDYTAYTDLFGYAMDRVTPVRVEVREADGFVLPAPALEAAVAAEGLGAYLVSNPNNPTGQVVQGRELAAYLDVARRTKCTLILDEFYSQFVYTRTGEAASGGVSGAEFVEDVDTDPVLLVDGLTKCFRYPGWRVGWVVGPSSMIANIDRAASAIDGGPPRPMQRLARQVLQPAHADAEFAALRRAFARKRALMVEVLEELGVVLAPGQATFYLWGSVAKLPPPLNDAHSFFVAALQRKVMVVPGAFFDIYPCAPCTPTPTGTGAFSQWLRFSFGPPEDNMMQGLARLRTLVQDAAAGRPVLPASA